MYSRNWKISEFGTTFKLSHAFFLVMLITNFLAHIRGSPQTKLDEGRIVMERVNIIDTEYFEYEPVALCYLKTCISTA